MARNILKEREGECLMVHATIARYGRNSSTYLLADIRDAHTGNLITDHLWIEIGVWASGFREGDRIRFRAEVSPYVKGFAGDPSHARGDNIGETIDWTLNSPRDAEIVEFGPVTRMMPDGSIRP